jgi:peptidyl-prolyl cis-trans isomerase SurA
MRTTMNFRILSAFLLMITGFVACGNDLPVAALVNGSPIYEREVEEKMRPVIEKLQRSRSGPLDDAIVLKIRNKALDLLIEREAILTSAQATKITISDNQVKQHLKGLVEDRAYGSLPRYKAYLASQGTEWTVWRAELKDSMIIDKLKEQVADNCLPCTLEEAKELYAKQTPRFRSGGRIKVSLIMLDPEASGNVTPRAFATGVANRLYDAGNEAWHSTALEFSVGPNIENGGSLGWIAYADLPLGFGREAQYLKPGEIKKISHQDFYYFLRLDDIEKDQQLSFDGAKIQIEEIVMKRKASIAWNSWKISQKEKAVIKLENN